MIPKRTSELAGGYRQLVYTKWLPSGATAKDGAGARTPASGFPSRSAPLAISQRRDPSAVTP